MPSSVSALACLLLDQISTPIGDLAIATSEAGRLRFVGFFEGHPRMESVLANLPGGDVAFRRAKNPGGATAALAAYFEGELGAIDDLAVEFVGSPFQVRVWKALCEIPRGETRSYGDIARRIGNPRGVRAVGLANGRNPVGIVVPCHRVIGANGTLTGYGGGVERKRWLLRHEGCEVVDGRGSSAAPQDRR
jgi:methylated-DNA-[protein]-cysteine S-methyltransferase